MVQTAVRSGSKQFPFCGKGALCCISGHTKIIEMAVAKQRLSKMLSKVQIFETHFLDRLNNEMFLCVVSKGRLTWCEVSEGEIKIFHPKVRFF